MLAGAVIGFLVALAPGSVDQGGTTFSLDQRLKVFFNVPRGLLIIGATIAVFASDIRVHWKEFFGPLLATSAVVIILWQMGMRGQLGSRWARRLRWMYRYEPYRYTPYVSPFDASIL